MKHFGINPFSFAPVVALILALATPSTAQGNDLSVAPSDTTVRVGDNALLQCVPQNQQASIKWFAYYTSQNPPKVQALFSTQPQGQPLYVEGTDMNKFVNNNTYDLVVKGAQLTDGAVYGCSPSSGQQQYANLVVIGDINVNMDPSNDVSVGTMVTITCTLNYGAPNITSVYKNLTTDQDPWLAITVGPRDSVSPRDLNAAVYRTKTGTKIAVVNTTITQEFVGSDITCEVTSKTGAKEFKVKSSMPVGTPTPPRQIEIKTLNGTMVDMNNIRVDDSINCSAQGYPLPKVMWEPLTKGLKNPASGNLAPGWAILTFDTARDGQMWMCSAWNNASTLNKNYTFNVKSLTGASVTDTASPLAYGSVLYLALLFLSLWTLLDNLRTVCT